MEERTCIGIIAEFDPFHRGHAHLIAQAKAALPGAPVVCAMSGPFTQRGEAAIVSKYARAEMALRCGADLVVELPVQWAVSSAESFARGGVQILHALGVTHLAFGSESGDLTALQIVAQALDSAAFPDALRPYLQQGLPFASARQKALETLVEAETAERLTRPNNLLGIEYLRAIQTLAPEMRALTVPRVGAAHNAAGVRQGFASASQLRQWLLAGELERACAQMPEPAAAETDARALSTRPAGRSFTVEAINPKASVSRASPARMAVASSKALWQEGRPRRRSSSSIAGRSSWMREYVWIISSEAAKGITASALRPNRAAVDRHSTGRRRLPPARRL